MSDSEKGSTAGGTQLGIGAFFDGENYTNTQSSLEINNFTYERPVNLTKAHSRVRINISRDERPQVLAQTKSDHLSLFQM